MTSSILLPSSSFSDLFRRLISFFPKWGNSVILFSCVCSQLPPNFPIDFLKFLESRIYTHCLHLFLLPIYSSALSLSACSFTLYCNYSCYGSSDLLIATSNRYFSSFLTRFLKVSYLFGLLSEVLYSPVSLLHSSSFLVSWCCQDCLLRPMLSSLYLFPRNCARILVILTVSSLLEKKTNNSHKALKLQI